MRSILLRFLNAPFFVLIVAAAVAVQSTLFNSYPLWYFQPDLVLIAVIWCALRRTLTEGGLLTLVFAMIVETHSSSPAGFFLCVYMTIFLGIRAFSRFFVISQFASLLIVTIASAVVWKILVLVVLGTMDRAGAQLYHFFITVLPFAGMEGLMGYWAYKLLDSFDRATTKSERSRQLIEDELLVEEGL
jgi:hypothetical protein